MNTGFLYLLNRVLAASLISVWLLFHLVSYSCRKVSGFIIIHFPVSPLIGIIINPAVGDEDFAGEALYHFNHFLPEIISTYS